VTFAQPLLLALLPPLAAFVLLLHARRRRDLVVASLPLWRRVAVTTGAAVERRRFPWRDPALWLQLAVVTAAVLALAQPRFGAPTPTRWIVVVDASSSMNALDVAPSRFEAARVLVGERFAAVATGDTFTLIRAAPRVDLLAAAWPLGPTAASALAALTPGDGAADWPAVATLVARMPSGRLLVVTDGYGAARARSAFAAVGVGTPEVVVLGETLVNVGLGDVTARARGSRADQWTIAGRVATAGFARGETLRVIAAYRPFGGEAFLPWGGVDVTLDAAGEAAFEFPLDLPGPGELELRGPSGDFLPSDDRAVLVLRPQPKRVAIVGPRDPALLRALAAVGDLDVFAAETIPDPAAAQAFDLVIVTADTSGVPATSTLWLGAVPAEMAAGAPLSAPLPPLAVGVHPLVADLDPAAITLARAQPLRLPTGATPLLRAGDAVLAWARTTDVGRQVMVGFQPSDGDWPAQLGFPAFLAAVVDRATPRTWSHEPGGCLVGSRCPWPREAFSSEAWLMAPDGGRIALDGVPLPAEDPLAAVVWDEAWFDLGFRPERSGWYHLITAGGRVALPVVAAPVAGAPLDPGDAAPVPPLERLTPPWRALAVAAALLVLADSALALRRRPVGIRRAALAWGAAALVAAVAFAFAALALPWPTLTASAHGVWVSAQSLPAPFAAARGWLWSEVRVRALGAAAVADDAVASAADPIAALQIALAAPGDEPRRRVIVDAAILPDLPVAQWRDLVAAADAAGVAIDVVSAAAAAPSPAAAAWLLERLTPPGSVAAGARYAVAARVQAPDGEAWRLRFERLDASSGDAAFPEPTAAAEVAGVGSASVSVDLQAGPPGEVRYRVTVAHDDRSVASTIATIAVLRAPKVLLVATDTVQGARLRQALEAQSLAVRTVTPFRMPNSLDALAEYDAVLLVNVPASEIFTMYQENLRAFVAERGGGLVIFGGDTAFGPGGYFRTALDDLSPLSAQITDEAPEVSVAFVLDRSGSMNGAVGTATRMDVAKVAVLESLELLGERSRAAVIVFDSTAQRLLSFTPTTDRAAFERALSSVRAAGGTAIYPGLLDAYELMLGSDAASRHVIVMTDGLSQDGDFPTVLGALRDLGISTSFVGVGAEADRRQLASLANLSGGALHFALDFRALPSLMAQEALMLAAQPIEERPTFADWVAGSVPASLVGVVAGPPPPLAGYVRTTLKDEATLHLIERERDDPLLASWRYGLGRVIAFASEVDGPWAPVWSQEPSFGPLWSQLIRWTIEGVPADVARLETSGAPGVLDVAVVPAAGVAAEALAGEVIELRSTDGAPLATQALAVVGDGRAVARFALDPAFVGPLVIAVPGASLERRVDWPLPPFAPVRSDLVGIERLAAGAGGALVDGVTWPAAPLRLHPTPTPVAWPSVALIAFFVGLMLRYGVRPRWFRGAVVGR
jgi:Mg-chelatase subunit ChlD